MPELSNGTHLQKAVGQNYTIYIPYRHTKGEAVPVVLLLHWGGNKYRYIGRDTLEQFGLPALTSLQAIIVAPDRKRRHWAMPEAEEDLFRLLEYVEANYNIDPKKRVVAGYSMGGIGVWYLASQRPEMFSCGVVVAAPVPEHIDPEGWTLPLFAVHGTMDEVFSYDLAKEQADRFQQAGAPLHFESVEFASHMDARDYIPVLERAIPWIQGHLGE